MRGSELAGNPASSDASCHGSFGELLQGALPEHGPFLVTLPIELRARARFVVPDSLRELSVHPESSWKSLRLAEALLRRYALPLRGELTLASEIPRGKGLASSTADLVATYRALARFHHLPQQRRWRGFQLALPLGRWPSNWPVTDHLKDPARPAAYHSNRGPLRSALP